MNEDGFVPTCIYATSVRNAIIASMIGQRLFAGKGVYIPIFIGAKVPYLKKKVKDIKTREGFDIHILSDWGYILIQKDLPMNASDKILLGNVTK